VFLGGASTEESGHGIWDMGRCEVEGPGRHVAYFGACLAARQKCRFQRNTRHSNAVLRTDIETGAFV